MPEPAVSGVLDLFFNSSLGDAHGGLRPFRRDAALGLPVGDHWLNLAGAMFQLIDDELPSRG